MPLRIRPRRIGTFSQWLQRTNKWCRLTTSTCCRCGNVLVEFAFFAGVIEWSIDRDPYCLVSGDAAGTKRNILSVTSVPFGSFSVAAYTISPGANVTCSGATCVTGTFAGAEIVLEP